MAYLPLNRFRDTWGKYELPTWVLWVVIHSLWFWITFQHATINPFVLGAVGGVLVCWHGSLQHECVHFHPTRSARLNALMAGFALGLWMPFRVYRSTHLEHHQSAELTLPGEDPESYYFTDRRWSSIDPICKGICWLNQTLLGRLLIGPPVAVFSLLAGEWKRLKHGYWRAVVVDWWLHALGVLPVLYWLVFVCEMPLLTYLFAFAWPGLSLTLLRSFAEHRPAASEGERTAIVESGFFWNLLYLNNNFHFVHHALPGLPWFKIRKHYRRNRETVLQSNGNLFYRGYSDIFFRFSLRFKDHPRHPGF